MSTLKYKLSEISYIITFIENKLRGEVILRFVEMCGIIRHHCLNFLFIIDLTKTIKITCVNLLRWKARGSMQC
jgi:hypothetical protein